VGQPLAADANARYNEGLRYENGSGGLPKDDREAARLYKLAADQGNANAQVCLGFFYHKGGGSLPNDDREAARLYNLAADQGKQAGRLCSPNDEERHKALLAYFMHGVAYILWDNIARGTQVSCPHIEKSCTSAYYPGPQARR
jgi:TPR repeat protein